MEFTKQQKCWRLLLAICLHAVLMRGALAQSPVSTTPLTLAQAEVFALKNHPEIASADFRSSASSKAVNAAKSAYYPTVAGNITGALVADPGTATAAGNLTTSSISNRFAVGGALLQMVTDFGRTTALVRTAQFQAKAQGQAAVETREQVMLGVTGAYFDVLGSEAVLHATQEAWESRRLSLRQITFVEGSSACFPM